MRHATWWSVLIVILVMTEGMELPGQQPDYLLDPSPYEASAELSADGNRLVLDNGLLRATLQLRPALAWLAIERGPRREPMLRGAGPLAWIVVDGNRVPIGGAEGQDNLAFLRAQQIGEIVPVAGSMQLAAGSEAVSIGLIQPRMATRNLRFASQTVVWPPAGRHVVLRCAAAGQAAPALEVQLHLEIYSGLPLISQWLELRPAAGDPVELDAFCSVRLQCVEAESRVEPERASVRLPDLHVETDFAFHAMTAQDGSSHCVRWLPDPEYLTQVNYQRKTRCLLEVGPEIGPALTLPPGRPFSTFRTWLLFESDMDRQRRGLAMQRMYETIAPWASSNPLMMHVRSSRDEDVRRAIDQCADVGFEMAILTFGSGFDIEDDSEENLERWRRHADYAHERSVHLGGYSLLSSRRILPDGDNCIGKDTGKPGGQVFGHAPALASAWGQRYFQKLYRFFEHTGFDLLEHDGSYPGDPDAAARPPLQKGYEDSRWVQYGIITEFYRWCRARGVYLNVPDWYFLQGSNKTGMGYRETNWSLPRDQQVLHTRQNLFDGTRQKAPSMGWMFVPLTEYHGGGAEATIEPLREHLPHYERMLYSNLGYGAQACYRGPRLYDAPETREVVRRAVGWFREHRAILEAPVIHGSSRRADGQWLDWVLHADARLDPPGMLVVFNPLDSEIRADLPLDLYYTGLSDRALVRSGGAAPEVRQEIQIDRRGGASLSVVVPSGGWAWYGLEAVK